MRSWEEHRVELEQVFSSCKDSIRCVACLPVATYHTFFNLSELNNLTLASGVESLKVSKLLQPAFVLPPILIYLDIEFQVNLSDSIGSDTQ